MSNTAVHWVLFDCRTASAEIKPELVSTLFSLAYLCDEGGGVSTTMGMLCTMTRLTERKCLNALGKLEEGGFITFSTEHAVGPMDHAGTITVSAVILEMARRIKWQDERYPGWRTEREWQRIRKTIAPQVYARDGHKCVYCGSAEDLTVDHVLAMSKGGTNDMANLVTCCKHCNGVKRNRPVERFIATRKPRA